MIGRDTMLNQHGKDTYCFSVCLLPGSGKWGEPMRLEQVLQNPLHLYLNCVYYVTDGRAFLCYIQSNNNSNRYNSNSRYNKPVCSLACLKKWDIVSHIWKASIWRPRQRDYALEASCGYTAEPRIKNKIQ